MAKYLKAWGVDHLFDDYKDIMDPTGPVSDKVAEPEVLEVNDL